MKAASYSSKPPLKRRKLTRSSTPSQTPTSAPVKVLTPTTNTNKGTPVCATCNRALQSTTPGSIIQCAICLLTTCAVCSRTCTHSAASLPPTPHLTWSPTPSPSPAASPRRSVLSLNSSNTNLPLIDSPLTPTQNALAGKRRNSRMMKICREFGPGCGRIVCMNCCYEDTHNNTTTCLSCYGSRT
ncbi:hypothetical protein BDZ97DRAFT_1788970 [Flammula alnicola]|nr:hypothetical protein BDZ97DRAFT_1788970 [Flammula alnicola]